MLGFLLIIALGIGAFFLHFYWKCIQELSDKQTLIINSLIEMEKVFNRAGHHTEELDILLNKLLEDK